MPKPSPTPRLRSIIALCFCSLLILQGYFALRVALWAWVPPGSTSFMREAQMRLLHGGSAPDAGAAVWSHDWRGYDQISPWLKRAVVASEDDTFLSNDGVDWDAIREAWQRNHSRRDERLHKVVGGSTITQQLAKNLFMSPQRNYLRKAQELVICAMLEGILGKRRILEIYLNSVEWGDGIYGAEAAAQHYFHEPASRLSRAQAARLAVMLPAPRYFQKHFGGSYLNARGGVIAGRALQARIPA
jgi:monofunctional biosynthetic peptidoglycan transglycosylase